MSANPRRSSTHAAHLLAAGLALGALLFGGCKASSSGPETGGETHFLRFCDEESESQACGGKYDCVCNVCTLPCDADEACAGLPGARCVNLDPSPSCDDAPVAVCELGCDRDADCHVLSSEHTCNEGVCRAGVPAVMPSETDTTPGPTQQTPSESLDASSATTSSEPDTDGAAPETDADSSAPTDAGRSTPSDADSSAAETDATSPSDAAENGVALCSAESLDTDLAILGDSFFGTSHEITAALEAHAREAGFLADTENYRDESNLLDNALASGGIGNQYDAARSAGPIDVVVMNGGGADVLMTDCDPAGGDCPDLANAALAAEELLQRMADDGVHTIVYAFYPNPLDDVIGARVDLLRPMIQSICEGAATRCHWLDLRLAFEGNYETLIRRSDGLNPTTEGSQVTADEIWQVLAQLCL